MHGRLGSPVRSKDADYSCGRFDKYLPYCRIIKNDDEQLEEHNSVHKVRLNQQQPSHVSLDECLKLFTKEERVSVFFHHMTVIAQ